MDMWKSRTIRRNNEAIYVQVKRVVTTGEPKCSGSALSIGYCL